jgi:hypothetical protein
VKPAQIDTLPVLQRKLRESEFFMRQMEDRAERPIGNYEEFDFYLSAFLSATRSITEQLQKRHGDWFARWRAACTDQGDAQIDFMCKQRIAEVHFSGADVTTTWREASLADLYIARRAVVGACRAHRGGADAHFQVRRSAAELPRVCKRALQAGAGIRGGRRSVSERLNVAYRSAKKSVAVPARSSSVNSK